MAYDTLDGDFSTVETAPRFASFGNRLGAAILDALCTLPIAGGIFYFMMFAPNWQGYVGVTLLAALYKPLMEGAFGATLGKMILKLKVVQKGGDQINWSQAFTRYVPWVLSTAISLWAMNETILYLEDAGVSGFMEYSMAMAEYQEEYGFSMKSIISSVAGWLPLISALFLLGNDRKQAAHDMLAETYVVHKDPV